MAPELGHARAALGRRAVVAITREVIAGARAEALAGAAAPGVATLVAEVGARAAARLRGRVIPVINATGVILHTNLGRAPLPAAALTRITENAGGYCALELDLETGARARRGAAAERRLAELVGAEDALVVNNNAAGVLLALTTLAAGREVVVSRGELLEIGGGFRIPEVLLRSGCRLVEVGTTNKTRVEDYEGALGDRTACVLRVHPGNFRMVGYAERPRLEALARLARERAVPLVKDLGGGRLERVRGPALASEPSVERSLAAGASVVCFSLDKLFGGPQGGAVVGDRALVHAMREDPLARALRVDKLVLSALEVVLERHERAEGAGLPVVEMLTAPPAELAARVERWRSRLGASDPRISSLETSAAVGGGSLAEAPLPSVALAIAGVDADELARALRSGEPAVVPRIEGDRVLLDARTVAPEDDDRVIAAVARALAGAAAARDREPRATR